MSWSLMGVKGFRKNRGLKSIVGNKCKVEQTVTRKSNVQDSNEIFNRRQDNELCARYN